MSQELLASINKNNIRTDIPLFRPGDRVKVMYAVIEGDKERQQPFEGDVIRIHRAGIATTFTVRKTSYGVGVERIFPLHSPKIKGLQVIRRGRVRRARLYYLRQLRGKASKIKELRRV